MVHSKTFVQEFSVWETKESLYKVEHERCMQIIKENEADIAQTTIALQQDKTDMEKCLQEPFPSTLTLNMLARSIAGRRKHLQQLKMGIVYVTSALSNSRLELLENPERMPVGGRRVICRKTRSNNVVAVLAAKA
jgi:hypothetical protein